LTRKVAKKNITAQVVADRFVDLCLDHGDLLTNLQLQKFLYYAQSWHLALYDQSLFPDRFEAWIHGPTQPEVYTHFRPFGPGPIDRPSVRVVLPPRVEDHLRDVLEAYGGFSAFDLERLSQEELPWQEARGGLAADEPSTAVINTATMRRYYKARLDEQATGRGEA